MGEFKPEEIYEKRETAKKILESIQQVARESLRRGRKPELPEEVSNSIENVINEVIDNPERSELIGVLPQYREEFKEFLIEALTNLGSELKRQVALKDSIFEIKKPEDILRLRLLIEMMIINFIEIANSISRKAPIPKNVLEKAKYIARFHDYEFIDKFLNNDKYVSEILGITPEEVRESFPKGIRLRFAVHNISDPLKALRKVKEHLDTILTDENIAGELNMTLEEVRESFPKWIRLRFAVYNISDPLKALRKVKEHLDTILTDENIAGELNMTLEEVRESFPKWIRLYLAVHNISDPLKALRKVKEHLDTILTDENIAGELNMTLEEVRESFPKWIRLYLAVHNISDPLKALRKVKEHLDTILTDENIAGELNMTLEEVRESFPKWMRLHFAVHNISDPLKALRKVKEHLDTILTDENIAGELNMTLEEVRESFPKWIRLYLAVHNISDPLKALRKVKEHLDTILTDENIAGELNMTLEEVRESFPKWMRLHFAVHNISDPLKALRKVKEHLDTILTDENIAGELNMTLEEVRESFPKGIRLRFAVHNISDPLKALRKVKEHLDTILTDENIAGELNMTLEEVRESFPKGIRLRFAVHNISDPLKALRKVKEHLYKTLTDENIANELGMSVKEAGEIFTKEMKLYFAVHNISNPLKGIKDWWEGKIKAPFKKPK